MLAATRHLRARNIPLPDSLDQHLSDASDDENDSCFRGFQIGHSYHYEWHTDMDVKKVAIHQTQRSAHQRKMLLTLEGVITPLATDNSGQLTVRLEIVAATMRDEKGW